MLTEVAGVGPVSVVPSKLPFDEAGMVTWSFEVVVMALGVDSVVACSVV